MDIQAKLTSTEDELVERAEGCIAGGVVSLNRKVSPRRIFCRGLGSRIWDIQGREYIDYHAAFAPHILGHNFPDVNRAVQRAMNENWSLMGSGTTPWEVELAELLCDSIPSLDLIQLTNTGSEAVSLAIRLAQAYTSRTDIILMLGGYNGWHSEVARSVMPTVEEIGPRKAHGEYAFLPASAGIPDDLKQRIHVVNFNDLDSVKFVFEKHEIACVLTEPVLQNIGVVLPQRGYLQGLVDLCNRYGALCIFDEVKTGFRTALGGYQSIAKVHPHLSVFGKAVANGYPLGVIGGRADVMKLFDHPDPDRRVLIAGTYNAHPLTCAAAIATINVLKRPETYVELQQRSDSLYSGLEDIFSECSISMTLVRNASAFCTYFCESAPHDWHGILSRHDFDFDIRYRIALIENGIYHIPIPCKQGSVSYAHSGEDIERTLEVTRKVLKNL